MWKPLTAHADLAGKAAEDLFEGITTAAASVTDRYHLGHRYDLRIPPIPNVNCHQGHEA